ncbi:MAG: restriction endonuclease subunit S [Lachnospiraceae bacterium]
MFEKGEYDTVRLGDVCTKITDGTHKTPNYLDDGITFISAKNIVNGELDFSDVKHISEDEYMEIQKRCQTEMNDILLSKSGSLGAPVIVKTEEKLGLFESLAVIKYDRTKLIPEFLCEQLKTEKIQRQFMTGTKGVAIKHLHLGVIADIEVIIPNLEEQKQFATFVHQVDKSKVAIQKSLDETQLLFDSLMQQYFG